MAVRRYNPRRQVAVRRAGVAGVAAYAARKVTQALVQRVRNYKYKSGRTTSRLESNLRMEKAIPKPKSVARMSAATGNELSTYRKTVGKYPRLSPNRLLKLMKSGMNEVILRAQGITQFDTNVGYYPLANRSSTDAGNFTLLPIHVWDLTNFQNVSTAQAGHAYRWAGLTGGVSLSRSVLPTTNPDGTVESGGFYEIEKSSGGAALAFPNAKNACHEWSDIRMNLMGARKRGTTYYIDILRVKDELSHPIAASVDNTEIKQLFNQWQSKLIYSNLQTYSRNPLKGVQVVKSFKFYVPGGSADDLDSIGKIKEFRLFLKQGNVYDMSWDTSGTPDDISHNVADGQDFTNSWTVVNSPRPGSRLLLVVRAFCPERRTNTEAGWNALGTIIMAPADPLTEPSYDLIIRNKWLIP